MAEYPCNPEESNAPLIRKTPMKCQLCGKETTVCFMLFLGDWRGLACPECIDQLGESQDRKYAGFHEQSEPAE